MRSNKEIWVVIFIKYVLHLTHRIIVIVCDIIVMDINVFDIFVSDIIVLDIIVLGHKCL